MVLRPTTGTCSIAIACQHAQHQLILPEQNAQEASQLPNFEVFICTTFKDVCDHLNQTVILPQYVSKNHFDLINCKFDLADVKGQLRPRRALEIAAAGGHSLLFREAHRVHRKNLIGFTAFGAPKYARKFGSCQYYSIASAKHDFGQRLREHRIILHRL